MAIEAQGTIAFWSTSTALSTAQKIGEVVGFNGPSGSAAVIDVTNLGSTAKEKIMGLPDEGQVTLDLTYSSTDVGQVALRNDRSSRTKRKLAVKLNDGSSSMFDVDAYVTGLSLTGAVDDIIKSSVTFELTGPVNWSTN